ncbi:unnamed protein product [Rotaria sordida]|uniref:Uncharacterized protein n=1 Tax=Rotaria sordida TaxID=392033 RepID=A0A814MBX1_9BILA|nr:unnamed protein product [Rotaria sordida]CAF3993750.1 unnamed protein product [Rotaria sordida]
MTLQKSYCEYVTIENNCQSRLRLAKLLDNNIFKLTSYDGFFNSTIEHINQRISQSLVGTSNNLPINQIPITQSTILAIEELNAKYAGRIHFVYKKNDQANEINTSQSFFLLILKKTFFYGFVFF